MTATDKALPGLEKLIPYHHLLDRHGSLNYGIDLIQALSRLEQMEFLARITLTAELLGGPKKLSRARQKELNETGNSLGLLTD